MFKYAFVENTPALIAMVIGLVILAVLFTWHAFQIAVGDKRSLTLMRLGFEVYGIGVLCKVLVIGPEFLRWYIADIGFPVAVGGFLAEISGMFSRRKVAAMTRREYTDWVLFNRQFMVIYAGILSIGYEFLTGFMYDKSGIEVSRVGNTDPIDMLMYVIGVTVALWFVRREKSILLKLRLEEDARIAEAAEEAKRARRQARKQAQKARPRATTKRRGR